MKVAREILLSLSNLPFRVLTVFMSSLQYYLSYAYVFFMKFLRTASRTNCIFKILKINLTKQRLCGLVSAVAEFVLSSSRRYFINIPSIRGIFPECGGHFYLTQINAATVVVQLTR